MHDKWPAKKAKVIRFKGGSETLEFIRNDPPAQQIKHIKDVIAKQRSSLREEERDLQRIDRGEQMPYDREVYEDSIEAYKRSIEQLEQHVRSLESRK